MQFRFPVPADDHVYPAFSFCPDMLHFKCAALKVIIAENQYNSLFNQGFIFLYNLTKYIKSCIIKYDDYKPW